MVAIDITHASGSAQFEENANSVRLERELAEMGDRYSELQPTSSPTINKKLIGKCLDICEKNNLNDGGSELRWSQGEVIQVSDGTNILKPGARNACYKKNEAVVICWDSNEDRFEPSTISSQRLLPSKWNPKGKHTEGAWRFDVVPNDV